METKKINLVYDITRRCIDRKLNCRNSLYNMVVLGSSSFPQPRMVRTCPYPGPGPCSGSTQHNFLTLSLILPSLTPSLLLSPQVSISRVSGASGKLSVSLSNECDGEALAWNALPGSGGAAHCVPGAHPPTSRLAFWDRLDVVPLLV